MYWPTTLGDYRNELHHCMQCFQLTKTQFLTWNCAQDKANILLLLQPCKQICYELLSITWQRLTHLFSWGLTYWSFFILQYWLSVRTILHCPKLLMEQFTSSSLKLQREGAAEKLLHTEFKSSCFKHLERNFSHW